MKKNIITLVLALIVFMAGCKGSSENKTGQPLEEAAQPKFEENWESLAKIVKEPEWFKDSKLGIYFHWGVYSVPAFDSEWYPRWMYVPDRGDDWGGKVYEYHKKTFGPIGEFDYHDFIPLFKASQFDAKDWATLFKNAGAKFAGPVAQHHDGFAMWGSKVNPWNVKDMGPKKDITGELFAELKKLDMKTIATFHHAKVGQRYANDSTNWAGKGPNAAWDSHFPYHPDYVTSSTDPKLRKLYGNMGEEEFNQYWLDQINEVVDQYAPDIIWFDSWLDKIPESYRKKMVAHHFNAGTAKGQEPMAIHKQKDLPDELSVLDIEQGGKTNTSEDYWMTDITITHGPWNYVPGVDSKKPSLLIRNMIDVWSKRGVVLLNISPTSDGVIPQTQRDVLNALGDWIRTHEEAVYETRGHTIFGYGDAEFEKGHFGGQSATMKYSASDFRFTTSKDGKSVYIYSLGRPEANSNIGLKHVFDSNKSAKVESVSVVGSNVPLKWSRDQDILTITTPERAYMNEIATVFKVKFE